MARDNRIRKKISSMNNCRRNQLQMARLRRAASLDEESRRALSLPVTSNLTSGEASSSAFSRKMDSFEGSYNDVLRTDAGTSNFIIVDISMLSDLIKNLCCPSCSHAGITIVKADSELGLANVLNTVCSNCKSIINRMPTSRRLGTCKGNDPFEINRRIAAAFLETGTGYAGLETFCRIMNVKCLHHKSFNAHADEIFHAAIRACEDTLEESVKSVRKAYKDVNPDLSIDDVIDIAVSYDASWMKRGHTSHFGVGSCIDLLTGLIIDYEVMTSFCKKCSTAESTMTAEEYQNWQLTHEDDCDRNHHGSAGLMEVKAAEILWMRSVVKHKLRYTIMLSDGDSKTFLNLQQLQPYGQDYPLSKEECINHVSKRMGTALRKLSKESKGKGVVLGGRGWGRLTEGTINKLTAYYGKAIRSNQDDLEGMRAAVFATFLHSLSTDEEPHHSRCPQGSNSWCFYNRALATSQTPGPHKENVGTPLRRDVGEHVKVVYERLGDEILLSRCLRGKTQNANESFHSIIWKLCPKTVFLGKRRVMTGVVQAVMKFNRVVTSSESILKELSIQPGKNMAEAGQKKDMKRMQNSLRSSTKKNVARHDDDAGESSYAAGAY